MFQGLLAYEKGSLSEEHTFSRVVGAYEESHNGHDKCQYLVKRPAFLGSQRNSESFLVLGKQCLK